RHQPHAAHQAQRPLHRRPVGRQVPEDLHLPEGDHRRGLGAGGRVLLPAVPHGELRRSRRAGEPAGAALRRSRRSALVPAGAGARLSRGASAMTASAVPALPVTPSFRLDGRRALVTGAGRGIGLAAAVALADAGAELTLASRTQAELDALAEAI